jgi:non-heme chloroperoxidase
LVLICSGFHNSQSHVRSWGQFGRFCYSGGLPIEFFDGFRAGMANRAQFYRDVPEGPFYGFNRPGSKISQGVIDNWWRQGMMGGTKAQYDCIKALSETDLTEDLKRSPFRW